MCEQVTWRTDDIDSNAVNAVSISNSMLQVGLKQRLFTSTLFAVKKEGNNHGYGNKGRQKSIHEAISP